MSTMSEAVVWSEDFEARPRDLEAELRAAWDRALRVDEGTLYRGMTLNLVAVAPVGRHEDVDDAIERLLVRHPTRAFVILLDPDATEPTMHVHVRVRHVQRGRHVILERITLRAAPSARGWLRSTVVPSLLDDLPTLLFWHGDLTYGEVFKELAHVPDHVVVDSTSFGDCDAPRQLLGTSVGSLIDLAEFRLKPWRRALAEGFERFTWQPKLGVDVEITHRDLPSARCASRILGRWLEQKLSARVSLVPAEGSGPKRQPLSVVLRNGDHAMIRVRHVGSGPSLEVEVDQETRGSSSPPFQIIANRSGRGDLLAAAADRCY